MTVIRAAAVQLSPVLYSREGTVRRVVDKIEQLGRQDVQFAVFPETIVPYDGRSSLTCVKPSSLIVVEHNPELLSAAQEFDAKLAALAEKVTATPPHDAARAAAGMVSATFIERLG